MQMTDEQVMTVAIAIVAPVVALIYSNSRISEAKETLRAEIKLAVTEVRNDITAISTKIDTLSTNVKNAIERMDKAVHIHELEHHHK